MFLGKIKLNTTEAITDYRKIMQRTSSDSGSFFDPIYSDLQGLRKGKKSIPDMIEEVKFFRDRSPELEYLIEMLSILVIFPVSSKKRQLIVDVNIGGVKNEEGEPVPSEEVSKEVERLLKRNDLEFQLFSGTKDLISYGFVAAYFQDPDFESVDIISPEDLKFKNKKIDIPGYKKIVPKRLFIISNEKNKEFGDSKVYKVLPYLRIINSLENSLFLERIMKSSVLTVWQIGVDDLDEEDVPAFISLFKQKVLSKVQITGTKDNGLGLDFSKYITNRHVFVPQTNPPLKIEPITAEFKPILDDIDYFWDKVYISLGVPIHLREKAEKIRGAPSEGITFHNMILSVRLKYIQRIWERFLEGWITKFLNRKGYIVDEVNVSLPEIDLQRRETDLDKLSKAVQAFFTLITGIGLPIKNDFILNTLFPGIPISDIIEEGDAEDNSQEDDKQTNNQIINLNDIFGNIGEE